MNSSAAANQNSKFNDLLDFDQEDFSYQPPQQQHQQNKSKNPTYNDLLDENFGDSDEDNASNMLQP